MDSFATGVDTFASISVRLICRRAREKRKKGVNINIKYLNYRPNKISERKKKEKKDYTETKLCVNEC